MERPKVSLHRSWLRLASIVFVATFVAVVLAIYVRMQPASRDIGPLGTLETQNLIVDSTSTLSSATATTLAAYNANKQFISYTGSGCGSGSAVQTIGSAGNVTCVSAGGGATPSIAFAHPTFTGPINLSTLGTVDWVSLGSCPAASPFQGCTSSQQHSKLNGHELRFAESVGNQNATVTSGNDQTFTSTITDDSSGAALNSTVYLDLFSVSGGANFGFRYRAVGRGSQLVLRIYLDTVGCTMNTTATLTSGTSGTDTFTDLVAANRVETITFTGVSSGDELSVTVVTPGAAVATSCVIATYAASLGPT